MKKTLFISIVMLSLCGCASQMEVKTALKDALIVGREVQAIETEQGNIDTAEQIGIWLDAGQKIYDTDSFESNCDLMLSVTDIAYDWLVENYPDKPYRVFIALFRSKLTAYCEGGGK